MRLDGQEQLALRLHQAAERADKLSRPITARFLTGAERSLAIHAAREAGVSVAFDGGWPEAERVQPCFYPADEEPLFTGVWMEARWNAKFVTVDHRALLGSLMALGMDRAFFGDIIVQEDRAYLYVLPEMAARLPMEWNQAGRATLTVTELDAPPAIEPPKGSTLKDTVASLRLNSVLASGMKLSRARAAEIIRQGSVMVDHLPEERVDRLLAAGQLLSIRGFGRVRLVEVGSPTRKDRLPIVLEVFAKT